MSRKRAATPENQICMESVINFIKTLEKKDLHQLEAVILKQLQEKPMSARSDPLFDNKLHMFDQGAGGELPNSVDIYPDEIHSFLLKWNNGDEMQVRVANQKGLMHAGTTQYTVEYVKIGDLELTASFPDGDRLPSGVNGINEFAKELKKHGISSKDDIQHFVEWILDNVDTSRCALTTNYVRYLLEEELLGDYYSDEEEEEEGDKGK